MKERISHDESNSSPSSLIYGKQTQFSTTICRPWFVINAKWFIRLFVINYIYLVIFYLN